MGDFARVGLALDEVAETEREKEVRCSERQQGQRPPMAETTEDHCEKDKPGADDHPDPYPQPQAMAFFPDVPWRSQSPSSRVAQQISGLGQLGTPLVGGGTRHQHRKDLLLVLLSVPAGIQRQQAPVALFKGGRILHALITSILIFSRDIATSALERKRAASSASCSHPTLVSR